MNREQLLTELTLKAVRSSGAGGQNVNKVASKVVLTFDILKSQELSEEEKTLLVTNLNSRLTSENVLILNCDEDRSQLKNKEIVIKRLFELLKKGLFIPKERKVTKVPKTAIRKRIKDKKSLGEIKKSRRKPDLD